MSNRPPHAGEGLVVEQSGALSTPITQFINPALLYVAGLMEGQSRKTGRDVLRHLARIMRWDDWTVAPWWKLTAIETSYIRNVLARDCAPATGRLAVNMLKGTLKQAFRVGLMDPDTYHRAVMIQPIKASTTLAGRMLNTGEIEKLALEIGKLPSPRGPMLEALFAIGLGCGLRREELAVMKIENFADDNAHLLVHGKGRRERLQALPGWTGTILRKWIDLRATLSLTNSWMFVQISKTQVRDRGLTPHHVWYLINELVKELNMDHFTPHDLRRTFASRMIGKADLTAVAKLMGHTNIQMTAHYDRRGIEAAEKAVAGLEACGFDKLSGNLEAPDVKKTIDIPKAPQKGLATIGEMLRAKPSLGAIAPPGAPLERGEGGSSKGAPEESMAGVEKSVPYEVENAKSNVIQLHPQTGQRLVSRRVVAKPDYLRDGKPLDLEWVRRQVKALNGREVLPQKIVDVLTKAGVRRGDGSKLWIDDVTRWSV